MHVHEVLGVHLGVNFAVVGPELGSAPGVLDAIGVEELGLDLPVKFRNWHTIFSPEYKIQK